MATKKSNTSSKKTTAKKEVTKPIIKEEVKEEIEDKVLLDKTDEIKEFMEGKVETKEVRRLKKHPLVNLIVIVLLLVSLIAFGFVVLNKNTSMMSLIGSLLLTVFVICFSVVSITYKRNSKGMILIGSLLLIGYFAISFINPESSISNITSIPNFSNKSITEVMKWATKNNITVNQEYEYSDMIPE